MCFIHDWLFQQDVAMLCKRLLKLGVTVIHIDHKYFTVKFQSVSQYLQKEIIATDLTNGQALCHHQLPFFLTLLKISVNFFLGHWTFVVTICNWNYSLWPINFSIKLVTHSMLTTHEHFCLKSMHSSSLQQFLFVSCNTPSPHLCQVYLHVFWSGMYPWKPSSLFTFTWIMAHKFYWNQASQGNLVTCDFSLCCDQKAQATNVQSFTPWQQATIEIMHHDHFVIACLCHIHGWHKHEQDVREEQHPYICGVSKQ